MTLNSLQNNKFSLIKLLKNSKSTTLIEKSIIKFVFRNKVDLECYSAIQIGRSFSIKIQQKTINFRLN
ncbi:hypothetical protein FUMI01_15390 [Flavobacterium sp. UMI-01]|nr:hypothetical protein FUMI01_15390 [Flavobacterium sp. UMI-01]